MESIEYSREASAHQSAALKELRSATSEIPHGWCNEYRVTAKLSTNPGDRTASAIVRVFDTDTKRTVVLTQPEKIAYGGPPLPLAIKETVLQVWRLETDALPLDGLRWIAHFNRASYFIETNVSFEPEFCEISIERAEDETVKHITLGRRLAPEHVAKLLGLESEMIYQI